MKRLALLSLAMVCSSAFAQSIFDPNSLSSDLKFDDVFARKPYTGRTASGYEWSPDDRYVTYLWNPYDTSGGNDLWIYDTRDGKSTRVTSMELFSQFDGEAGRAIERYKKEKEEELKRLMLGDQEYREEMKRIRTENEKRREPLPGYGGVSEYEWAHKSNQLLMVFKGDVYRWRPGEAKPTRLTKTREGESQIEWLPDDSGYTFRRGSGVYRVKFDSAMIEQLNPELPSGVNFNGYFISPDGNRMAIFAGKPGGQERQVDWIVYRDRFAQARKTTRGVADDDFSGEQYLYVFNIAEDEKGDGKPFEVWKWPGGEEWQETSLDDKPWSADSKRFTFVSWKRDKKELLLHIVDVENKKVTTALTTTSDGEHRSPSLASPTFTPDGNHILLMLDQSGYRQIHAIDLRTNSNRQVTKGNFETYPIEVSKDGKSIFVRSTKEHPSRFDIYRVDIATGDMARLSPEEGFYGNPTFSNKQDRFISTFRNWDVLNETYIVAGGKQTAITESHNAEGFKKILRIKPQLFSYPNRHGQTVHGYMFLPQGFKPTDKRPLMIYVYGGPLGVSKSVEMGDFNSSAYLFNMYLTHVLGYVTVTIDPRGQSGYGNEFGKANWEKPGVAQTEDLTDGVKYLIANYGVDPTKVAINGWSFGGFQTQMCMYTAPDVFTLGIAGAGPTEWQNYNTWYTGGVIGNSPKGNAEYLDKYSLTKLAKNLRNPLLLLHGMEDTNVLFQDTVKVYRELLQYGKGSLVELALDPTGGHGMGGDMNNRDRHAIYLAFILKHWGMPKR
jgi:dipeptidyl-peptidase-4